MVSAAPEKNRLAKVSECKQCKAGANKAVSADLTAPSTLPTSLCETSVEGGQEQELGIVKDVVNNLLPGGFSLFAETDAYHEEGEDADDPNDNHHLLV